jgi:hypothetical protein
LFDRILQRIRRKIHARQYVMTLHAVEKMEDDGLTILDVEHCILTGEITERQKDKDSDEWKYLIRGQAIMGPEIIAVTKLSPTDKLVIITVYLY